MNNIPDAGLAEAVDALRADAENAPVLVSPAEITRLREEAAGAAAMRERATQAIAFLRQPEEFSTIGALDRALNLETALATGAGRELLAEVEWLRGIEEMQKLARARYKEDVGLLRRKVAAAEGLAGASDKVGAWLSAALSDESVCAEMKRDIEAWFAALSAWQEANK